MPQADVRKSLEIYTASLELGGRLHTRVRAVSSHSMRLCQVMKSSHQEKLLAERGRRLDVFVVWMTTCRQSRELEANS